MTTVVVGAGPAGLLTAITLAAAGNPVHLVDEQASLGGHLRYDAGYAPAGWLRELTDAVDARAIQVNLNTVVWAAYRTDSGFDLMLSTPVGPSTLNADSLVLATGTTDRETHIPGSTLPGVLTERALRILLNIHGVLPGARYAIIGDDELRTARLADELRQDEVEVSVHGSSDVIEIGGIAGVQHLTTRDLKQHPVDIVVLALGERPDTQLAGMLEIDRSFSPEQDAWIVSNSNPGPGLYAVGGALHGATDLAGIVRTAVDVSTRITGTAQSIGDSLPITRSIPIESRSTL